MNEKNCYIVIDITFVSKDLWQFSCKTAKSFIDISTYNVVDKYL